MTTRLLPLVLALSGVAATARQAAAQDAPPERPFSVVAQTFVAVLVEDADSAARWYARVLGLTEVNTIDGGDGRYSIRILEGQGLTVELIRLRGAEAPEADRPLGLFKVGFFVDDIDAAYAWLADLDVDVDQGIFHDEALAARSFVFRDPYGNRLQLFQRCGTDCTP
jgi:catechol 2,3-dioxygenase-like lactoylglutathione lyase family enzyme